MSHESSLEFSTIPEITHIYDVELCYPMRMCVNYKDGDFITRSLNVPCPVGRGKTIGESVFSLQREFLLYWRTLKDSCVLSTDANEARKQYCNILNVQLPDASVCDFEQPDDEMLEDD